MGLRGMQVENWDFQVIISLSVAFTSLVLAVGVAYLCRHSLRLAVREIIWRVNRQDRARALYAAEYFKTNLREFRSKIEMVEEYSPEYHNSFSTGGWAWLTTTAEHLASAEQVIDGFLASGRNYDAYMLSAFLNAELEHADLPLAAMRFADFVDLLDWQERAKHQLLQLIEAVKEGAEINQEIGLKRHRKRKATIHALEDLRRQLGK